MVSGRWWDSLLASVNDLSSDSFLITPLSRKRVSVRDTSEDSIEVEYHDGKTDSLRREQFEILTTRVKEARNGFDFDRLPPNAEPYAAVLSLSPQIEADTEEAVLRTSETQSGSPLVETHNNGTDETVIGQTEAASQAEEVGRDTDPLIEEMIENMGDPGNKIVCPIEGCGYSHRSAESVAAHVSRSSSDKHIWSNTDFAGWRDFIRQHR